MSRQSQKNRRTARKASTTKPGRKPRVTPAVTERTGPGFAEYLASAKSGDREAFGNLYVESCPILRAALREYPPTAALSYRGGQDVDDVLNSAFAKALASLQTYDPDQAGFGWLLRITLNTGVDFLRRQNRMPRTGCDLIDLKASRPQNAEEIEELTSERRKEVDVVHAELTERERWAYRARFVEGKKYRVMASELGVPVNTVATIIRRLRLKIRSAVHAL